VSAGVIAAAGLESFHPTDISGCVLWLSARAISGMSDAQLFSDGQQWTDNSGASHHAVSTSNGSANAKYRTTAGPGSGPAIEFQATAYNSGTGYFDINSNPFGTPSAVELFFGAKSVPGSSESGEPFWFNNSNDAGFHPYVDGKIYPVFGTTVRKAGFTPTVTITNTWRHYNYWSAANDWSARIDGNTQETAATNTVDTFRSVCNIGASSSSGVGTVRHFIGLISYVIAFNRKLTTTERSDLETWLAANPSGGTP
jgi:hypothetical protein